MNAGQICMSPDYVLVHKDAEQALTKMMAEVVKEFAPRKGKDKTETLGKIVAERALIIDQDTSLFPCYPARHLRWIP